MHTYGQEERKGTPVPSDMSVGLRKARGGGGTLYFKKYAYASLTKGKKTQIQPNQHESKKSLERPPSLLPRTKVKGVDVL